MRKYLGELPPVCQIDVIVTVALFPMAVTTGGICPGRVIHPEVLNAVTQQAAMAV